MRFLNGFMDELLAVFKRHEVADCELLEWAMFYLEYMNTELEPSPLYDDLQKLYKEVYSDAY